MTIRAALFVVLAGLAAVTVGGAPSIAEPTRFDTAEAARQALDAARMQQRTARARGERLERNAARAREAADRAVQRAAALAARVQQAEAGIAAAEARLSLTNRARRALDRELAERRTPLVQLTAALQSMARRPLVLSALQRGSLRDLVHTRAALAGAIPVVRSRTEKLRGNLRLARALEDEAGRALADRRDSERALLQRRTELVALAAEERRKARMAAGGADREARRALILAEEAYDLDALVGKLEAAGRLRERLAALPGPVPRPADPDTSGLAPPPAAVPTDSSPPAAYQLPVAGEVLAGFGEAGDGGPRRSGLTLAPRPGAQVVSPGAGRVAFAGPYRGYGHIVIVEHSGGWTSVVTGLERLDAAVGQNVTAGSPLGIAADRDNPVTLELRHEGEPVNPLDLIQ